MFLSRLNKQTERHKKHFPVPSFAFALVCVEVLRLSQPNGSCRARLVYLTTRLLGRLSPLSG